jgi:hypothetical protein
MHISGFSRLQNLSYIAGNTALGPIIGNEHITTIFEASLLPICWSNPNIG